MKIHRLLLLCVSSAFLDGRRGLAGAQTDFYGEPEGLCCSIFSTEAKVYSATEGGTVTVTCSSYPSPHKRKLLWRGKCDQLLATTDGLITASEKYRFEHVNASAFNVSIAQLTESDSGRYTCGAGRRFLQCEEFEIRVTAGVVTRRHPCVYLTAFFLLLAICVLLLYRHKTRIIQYVNGRLNGGNTEISADYDDCVAASTGEASAYQHLDPHTRDLGLYCTLQSNSYFDVK